MYDVLKNHFGYDEFRGGQVQLVSSILNGEDTVGIMPTGAGKSICFQVPALMFEGITLVISPLISLMKDQVMALVQSGVSCAYLNSSLNPAQQYKVLENARNGVYKIIYVAPERLTSEDFLSFAQNVQIDMITVDEAHCISQWGQDFRPSYTEIPNFIAQLPKRPIVSAFTATATLKVREDIIDKLNLSDPLVLVTGFDRENLHFAVVNPRKKMTALLEFLAQHENQSGIVYCMSRKNTEKVCEELCELGYAATRYHAGLTAGERHENQDDFLYDRKQIMVATNAFGMGIDKSNVNFVVHYNMPKDLESYYQEAGRAGRDGTESHCLLIYNAQDVRTNEWLIDHPNGEGSEEIDPIKHEQDMQRLRQMTFYSTTNNCLRAFILKYFGENPDQFCGNCSNCQTQFDSVDVTVEAQKIISCVKRMGERFGIAFVIDVLRGSKNQKIYQWGFQDLSTYGIMQDTSMATARNIADFLIQETYLIKTDDQYPIIKLGARAKDLLTKDAKLEMKLAREKTKKEKSQTKAQKRKIIFDTLPENKVDLFELIKQERSRIASILAIPPYYIFTDKTLVDMANKCPTTNDEFLAVNGVGENKLEKFGEDFMGVIRAYLNV